MAEAVPDANRAEPEEISTSLSLEQLDTNLFRSKSLWLPYRARGVFGGQVISQAIVAATACVKPQYALHSLHSYFLLSASPAVPILYYVDRVREGRTYTTRSVRAVQNGKTVFILICSFQVPETWQPSHHWPIPPNVLPPEQCEDEKDRWIRSAQKEGLDAKISEAFMQFADERHRSPVEVRRGGSYTGAEGTVVEMVWMKTKSTETYEIPFQKGILGYMSDFYFLGVAASSLGLKRHTRGPEALSMLSTLDHSIFFYSNDFDCNDWVLYVVTSPAAGSGRGFVIGRMYSRNGTLIAVTTQEGVIRADIRPPPKENPPAKL